MKIEKIYVDLVRRNNQHNLETNYEVNNAYQANLIVKVRLQSVYYVAPVFEETIKHTLVWRSHNEDVTESQDKVYEKHFSSFLTTWL